MLNFVLVVTGAVNPGSLVALMGGSGAGKTTLMAALAYRNPGKQAVAMSVLVTCSRVHTRRIALVVTSWSGCRWGHQSQR